jgi:hypothetical protein
MRAFLFILLIATFSPKKLKEKIKRRKIIKLIKEKNNLACFQVS